MRKDNIKKFITKKAFILPAAGTILTGAFLNQYCEIKQLEKELYIQQNMTEQRHNYTETLIDTSSIKEQLNEECNFKVLDGTINIRHTYVYQRDSIFGMKSKYRLVGNADFYYSITVDLSQSHITRATNQKIIIEVPRATIDKDAYHRVPNSFVRLDSECDTNLLANKNDAERATRQWEDSFDTKGAEYVESYMNRESIKNKIDQNTKRQVKTLFEKLGYSQEVEVRIIDGDL